MCYSIRFGLCILSGVLASLCYPPVGWWWLVLVAWLPLLIALNGVKHVRSAFYMGLVQGLVFYGISFSWMVEIFGATAGALFLVLAFFVGVFGSLWVRWGSETRWGALLMAVLWTGLEFFRSELFILYFPWGTPGLALGPNWLSPLIGVYGLSFLVILAMACLVLYEWKGRVMGVVLVTGLVLSSLMQPEAVGEKEPVRVLALQEEDLGFSRKLDMTNEVEDTVDVVLWPEMAVPVYVRSSPGAWKQVLEVAEEHKSLFIFGTMTKSGDSYYNTAMAIEAGKVVGEHYKNHPVPLFSDGKKGTEAQSVSCSIGSIGMPICYDNDHEDVVRRMVADGAEMLLVPSMDAAMWTEREHAQHAELFRHRCAENRRWMAVASSSGMTQIIDSNGVRRQALPLMDEGILVGDLYRESGRTFYNRYGWLLGWICFVTASIFISLGLIWSFVNSLQKRFMPRGGDSGETI